jgi:UDP-N-acetylglucosamine--N-acetylmuramyl-(pentapeptide) pyrophosphoryl-undecaprenol N-acetylglucosamine transferase
MLISKKIVLTGTHLTPAAEFIRQLQNDPDIFWEISYIGRIHNSSVDTTPAVESKVISKTGVKYFGINCGKLDRRWFLYTLKGLPETLKGLFAASKIIKSLKPDYVVSFGGYVSVPVILSSFLNQVKSVTHEQTSTLSLSTKINSLFCHKVALSFPITKKFLKNKFIVTGNLLRREIFLNKSSKFDKLKIEKPIIYITGGNQGSLFINNLIKSSLPLLSKSYFIIHQCGQKFKSKASFNYLPLVYIDSQDIGWILNHAALMISRAGANTCQEIATLKIKSILIPLKVSQQNEQIKNAAFVKTQLPNITTVIPESKLNPPLLLSSIEKLIRIEYHRDVFKPKSNLRLLKLIKTI